MLTTLKFEPASQNTIYRNKYSSNNQLPRRQRLKPGPIVTATAERSASVNLALSSASCTTCKQERWENHIYSYFLEKIYREEGSGRGKTITISIVTCDIKVS